MKSLKEIAEQIRGVSYKGEEAIDIPKNGFIPILRANNINNGQINLNNLVFVPERYVKRAQLLKRGDILIATSSGSIDIVGKAGYVDFEKTVSFGAFCKLIRPDAEKVDVDFLKFFFQSSHYRQTISQLASGANINNLKNEHLDNLAIPLPPLPEQQRIAAVLDAADGLRRLDRELVGRYDALIQSVFYEMFGDPVKNEKGWEVRKLGEVIQEGPQNGLYKPSSSYGKGVGIIRIDSFNDGLVDLSRLKFVEVTDEELARYEVKNGDFLINRVNSRSHLGKCGLVGGLQFPCVFESNMMKFTVNKFLTDNYFLLYVLKSLAIKNQILGMAKDSINQSSINQKDVLSLQLMLPPLAQQQSFAARVQAIEAQKALAVEALGQSEVLMGSLMGEVFGG